MGEVGWRFSVVTSSNPRGMPIDASLEDLIPKGTEVSRVYHPDPMTILRKCIGRKTGPNKGGVGQESPQTLRSRVRRWLLMPDRVITWAPTLIPAVHRVVRRTGADVIVSTGPPHSLHLMAWACSRLCSVPFVPYFGDLWSYDSYVDFSSNALQRLHSMLEAMVVGAASGIVTTTPRSSDYFRRRYGRRCPPVHTVINGYDPDLPAPEAKPAGKGSMRVVYTGNFVGANTPDFLPRGFELFLERNPEARVEFRFFGRMEGGYEQKFQSPLLRKAVRIHGTVARERAASEQVRGDLLLACLVDRPGAELKNPAKIAEYARAGRRVLAIGPQGDMTDLVDGLNLGYTAAPKPEAVASALERAYADHTAGGSVSRADFEEVDRVFNMRSNCRSLDLFLRREVLHD